MPSKPKNPPAPSTPPAAAQRADAAKPSGPAPTTPTTAVAQAATSEPGDAGSGAAAKRKPTGAADIAAAIVAGTAEIPAVHYAKALDDDNPNAAAQGARVLEELAAQKPELCAPHIERLVRALWSSHARVVQAGATCLPILGKVAPAKVARHLDRLQSGFDAGSDVARDGIVRTLVALCLASVAYQRRVVDLLEKALAGAEPKTLQRWTEVVLPALKGEPHAQARSAVERRLPELPRPIAEKIAEQLGIKLRPSMFPR